jgi:hypothetical protein
VLERQRRAVDDALQRKPGLDVVDTTEVQQLMA